MKKLLFRLTVWLTALTLIAGYCFLPTPVIAAEADIQDGVTLHCWNWSFANIEANMATIARMGYTAIQTSPIQQAKQTTAGYQTYDWWVFYQPASFSIDNTGKSALGNKAQFQSMCQTAHKYGIKVIVDVVANHMGDNGGNNKSPAIIDDIEKDASCWHDISKNTYDYSKRYDVTQWCMGGLPDLNTGSSKVQNYVLGFLKECIDCGADGFRFDAAKHIETPEDGGDNCASNFWPTVVNGAKAYAKSKRGIDLYCYGELLDSPGGNLSVSAYTKYMSITDNTWSNHVRNSVVSGGNAGNYGYRYHKDASASKLVLWAESHDNYAGDGSNQVSTRNINKTWALVAARADAMGLYLARPSGYTQKLGTASPGTGWANKEVAAVNKFHTAFAGKSEYVATEGKIAYVERGDSGVVLVNCGGDGQSVSVTNHTLKNGTYTDQISGNSFTVSGGKIRGNIGATGIAVVYDAPREEVPETKTLYFVNSGNWSKVNLYSWYTGDDIITSPWPGDAMEKVEGKIFSATLPADATNVIFNNGSNQTDDLTIPAGKNCYDYATGKWSVYAAECTHPAHNASGNCTKCGEVLGHSYGSSGKCICGKVCPHEKHNTKGTCTLCGGSVSHRYVGGKCDCGMTQTLSCAHGRHGSDGICPDCGAGNVHRFVAGSCYCGAKEMPIPDTTAPTQPEVPTTTQPLPVTTEPVTEFTTQPVTTQPQATAAPETNPTTESETGTAPAQPVPPEPKPPVPFAAIGCTAAILAAVGVLIFMKIRKSKQS